MFFCSSFLNLSMVFLRAQELVVVNHGYIVQNSYLNILKQ